MVGFCRKGFLRLHFVAFGILTASFSSLFSEEVKAQGKGKFLKPSYTAILVDAHSGKVLYSDHSRKKVHPSSLTKIMALYEVFRAVENKEISMDSEVIVSEKASSQPPCKLNLRPGQRVRVRDMVLGGVTKSGNDAMVVLAEAVSKSEEAFVQRMNASARRLGMKDTYFGNVSGLPNPAQVTTAYDMALLSRAFIKHFPSQYRVFSTKNFAYRGEVYNNHNKLVGQTLSVNGKRPVVDGIKTGFTCASGFNLAASAVHGDKRVIAVVMGGVNPQWRNQRIEQLLSFGFSKELHPETSVSLASATPTSQKPVEARPQSLTHNLTDEEAGIVGNASPQASPQPLMPSQGRRAFQAKGQKWAIQTGAFRSSKDAEVHLKKVVKLAKVHLAGGKKSTIPSPGKGKKRRVKARITNLTQSQAIQSCKILQKRGLPCLLVS